MRSRSKTGGSHGGSPRALAWLVLVTALVASPASAAEDEEDLLLGLVNFDELGLDDELALLAEEDVVVSASRHAQRIEDSPSAITVLTREAIRQSGVDNLADLLRLVPGVDVFRTTAAQPSVGIRSNTTIAGDLLLVLVDGRIALWPGLGQALWMSMPFDIQSVERVEVIRGPGSSVYGANALQGVINVVTRRPGDGAAQAEVSLAAAPGDTFEASARVHGTQGNLSYWASAGLVRQAPYDRPFDADLKVSRARAFALWKISPEIEARLEAGAIFTRSSFYTVIGTGRWENLAPYLLARLETPHNDLQLVFEQSAVEANFNLDLSVPLQDGEPPLVLGTVPPFDLRTRTLELEANHWLRLFEGNRLTVGGVGQLVDYHSGNLVTCSEGLDPETFELSLCDSQKILEFSAGAFAQDEWRLFDVLTLTVGGRFDVNTTQTRPAFSPRAALVWTPAVNHAFRVSVGRAIRKPTYLESFVHIPLEGGPGAPPEIVRRLQYIFATALGNDALDYEVATSGELGYRTSLFEGKLGVTLDLFLTDHRTAIFMRDADLQIDTVFGVPVIAPDATLSFANNTGSRRTAGGELVVRLAPTPWLDFTLAYAGDFLIRDDQLPAFTRLEPEHRIIGSLRLDLPANLDLALDAFWASAYADDVADPESILAPTTLVRMGAWTLVNARLGWRVSTGAGEIEIGARVFNLLGAHARESAGVDLPQGGSFGGIRLERRATLYLEGRF